MKTNRTLTVILLLALACVTLSASASAAERKVVVKVNSANVRLKPDLASPVVGKATIGLILSFEDRTEGWYLVELPPNDKGVAVRGYIHESVVQEFAEGAPVPADKPADRPAPAVRRPARRTVSAAPVKKLYARIGAGYASKSFSYEQTFSFTMYQETGQVAAKYDVDASGVTADVGIGFMFTPSVGVELSFIPINGKSKGTFTGRFPHPLYFDAPREKDWTNTGLKYTASELNLDLVYAFPISRKLKAYVMAGGTYFLGVKVGNLKAVDVAETGYPYLDLNVTPQYADYSASAFGFNAGAGVDFSLGGSLALNLNARYSSGTAKIKVEGEELGISAGGLRATAGIKVAF